MNDKSSPTTYATRSWPLNALDEIDLLKSHASRLRSLGRAFHDTGNEKVAQDLYESASEIFASCDALRDSISDSVNTRFKETQESSGNMIRAVLAMSQLNKPNRKSIT